VVEQLVRDATRVVGAYHLGQQVGFARCFSDRVTVAWLADVYVDATHRGRGIGEELVRTMIDGSTFPNIRWMLGTADAHSFYAKFGFGSPSVRILERPRPAGDPPAPKP
jgi:GNAT superfamily N-acetyltransferase